MRYPNKMFHLNVIFMKFSFSVLLSLMTNENIAREKKKIPIKQMTSDRFMYTKLSVIMLAKETVALTVNDPFGIIY